ncbi:MAG: polysaccharide export protein [Nitrospiraceae bacterium]|nr:MAG: polysaccharide export protein [Nitrospiraceae bacterium]
MTRYIAALIITGIFAFFAPALSGAGIGDTGTVAADPSMSMNTAPDALTPEAPQGGKEAYLIGPGDVLNISVWKDEALNCACVIRPDGFFSFPLIGDVQASERTTGQIRAEMEMKLERYAPGVVLSLEVKQINSMIIYVIGKVNAPGRYVMNTNVDVLQALATAGGLNEYAKRNRVKIFRQETDATTIFPFEYDEVVDGRRLEQNIRLKRGDVVVIP